MVVVRTIADFTEALMYAQAEGLRVHILGAGTNTFFGADLKNIVIIKNEIKGISFEQQANSYILTAGAGETWDDVVMFSVKKKLWGIENLSYIPGTVGAAPVQNIGAYGVQLQDVFVKLSAIDMETLDMVEISLEACAFGYRDSLFKLQKGKYCIISVTMRLSTNVTPTLTYAPLDTLIGKEAITPEDVRELVITTRKSKLPDWKEYPNAGSFFKNPVVGRAEAEGLRALYPEIPLIEIEDGYKIPAAWLIEHVVAMKGVRTGNIGTWPTQPLVIVNYGEASTQEILDFTGGIITKIKEATGMELEREVNFVK